MLIADLREQYRIAIEEKNFLLVKSNRDNTRITFFEDESNQRLLNSKIYTEKHNIGSSYVCIGPYCSISFGCSFILGGNHDYSRVTTYLNINNGTDELGLLSNGDICLEGDNWVGMNSTILSGVTIGVGAVVAANSTVTKNVEPYSIVGGSPAKHIKYRFDSETIDKLLETKWWEYDLSQLKDLEHLLFSNNVPDFISKFKEITH